MKLEEIWKAATTEADWLRYYGHYKSRLSESFLDHNFYDRIESIGYTKRVIALPNRCIMMYVSSDKPVLESDIEELYKVSGPRNHKINTYSALEYLISRKIGTDQLIKIIKGE